MQSKSQWDITSYPLSMKVRESESEVAQWCPTLCDPVDCSPPDSFLHGILQARLLECVAYVAFFKEPCLKKSTDSGLTYLK